MKTVMLVNEQLILILFAIPTVMEIMLNSMWHEEHILNVSVLKENIFPTLFNSTQVTDKYRNLKCV
jgi:hypothetical protein